jgi:restriction system protein
LSIPDFQSFFLPLLLLASDGNIHSVRDAIETLSNQFNLSDEERKALLPSGTQRIVDNRIGWARTYLTNLITTSSYSKEAVMWVSQVLILLKSKGLKLIIFMRSEV